MLGSYSVILLVPTFGLLRNNDVAKRHLVEMTNNHWGLKSRYKMKQNSLTPKLSKAEAV